MKKLTTSECDVIIKLYRDEKHSMGSISRMLPHGVNTINRVLKEAGVVRSKNRFEPDQESQIAIAYEAGSSLNTLGEEYGCDLKTIHNIVKRHGVLRRRRGGVTKEFPAIQAENLVNDWRAWVPRADILKKYDISGATLSRFLRSRGEEPRRDSATGKKHGRWKGGRIVNPSGYVMAWVPIDHEFVEMTNAMGYIPEHRLVIAEYMCRPLLEHESVHHIDGNRQNNRIDNLQLRIGQHVAGQSYCCADCGSKRVKPVELA